MTDRELLRAYVERRDQEAFAEVVRRHVDWVYGVARRGAAEDADDVTQAVFWLLARRAGAALRSGSLDGWLFRVARYGCCNARRARRRRALHEREAGRMAGKTDTEWREELVKDLDAAIEGLPKKYREAVLARFLQGRSLEEAGALLGLSAGAVSKVTGRALEKLRVRLARRGHAVEAGALAGVLAAEAGKTAPAAMAHAALATATASGGSIGGGGLLSAGKMAWWKVAAVVGVTATVVGTAGWAVGRPAERGAAALPAVAEAAPEEVDESKVPGEPRLAVFEMLVEPGAAEALRGASEKVEHGGTFFELRQGKAAGIRARIKEQMENGQIISTGPSLIRSVSFGRLEAGRPWEAPNQGGFDLITRPGGDLFVMPWMPAKYLRAEAAAAGVRLTLNLDHAKVYMIKDTGGPPNPTSNQEATVHWSGGLEPGRMLLMIGDFGPLAGDHVVYVRGIEAYKATAEEQQCVEQLDSRWIRGGPAELRGIADRVIVWAAEAAGKAGTLAKASAKWTRRLSDGTTVELLAVEQPLDTPCCRWDPDGRPLGYPFLGGYNEGYLKEGQTPGAVALRVLGPVPQAQPDIRALGEGLCPFAIMPDDTRVEVYVSVGPWIEEAIGEMPLTIGDATVAVERGRVGPDGRVSAMLRGNAPADLEVRLAAITKDGQRIIPPDSDHGRLWVQPLDAPEMEVGLGTVVVAGERLDHFVVVWRKREKVVFEGFAQKPVVEVPERVTAEEVAAAARQVKEIGVQEREAWWAARWKEREGELAAFGALPRDAGMPAGAVRVIEDKAEAGDEAGLRGLVSGTEAEVAGMARMLAARGRALVACEKKFGREVLAKETWKNAPWDFARGSVMMTPWRVYLPAEMLLVREWTVRGDRASNGRGSLSLVRRDGVWRVDAGEWMAAEDMKANVAVWSERSAALVQDVEGGKVDATAAAVRLGEIFGNQNAVERP